MVNFVDIIKTAIFLTNQPLNTHKKLNEFQKVIKIQFLTFFPDVTKMAISGKNC